MRIYRGFSDRALRPRPRAVAVGIFDGVHRGHLRILRRAISEAKALGGRSMAVTFDPHPAKVLLGRGQNPPIILSLAHRLRLLERAGIDETLVVRFDRRFSRIPRETFLDELLLGRLGMRSLAVGKDFRFGRGGRGNAAFLGERTRGAGFRLRLVAPLLESGRAISSTRIRRLIERGRLREASRLLGRPVTVCGTVVRGRGRGRKLGFPTANLDPHHETLPPAGVYAARGLLDGRRLEGVLHIGERPTFAEKDRSLEAHFFDFHERIYGREVELFFAGRLRGIRRFAGAAELVRAIRADSSRARRLLARPSRAK